MKKPERPQQASRKPPPKPPRGTLAAAVGGLPLPPRLAKPPAPAIHTPIVMAPPKASTSRPHPPKGAEHASSATVRPSVAGRLGAFGAKRLASPSGSKKRR
jgi:hypothetical protein